MANRVVLDLDLLRGSTPRGQATYLRNLLNSNPDAESSITPQLIALVASDSLPSIALSLWPSASKEPQTTIAVIRQEHCLNVQQAAITRFYRLLCKEKTFAKTWEAAGGATGVAQLMAKLSVSGVRFLVKWLGVTGRAQGARRERHKAMEELLTLLWGLDGDENAALDSRPLRDEYVKILPACGGAFQLQWKEMKRQLPDNYDIAVETDHEFFEQHYDEKLRRNEIKASEFLTAVYPLVIHRTQYGLDVLDRFIDSETLLGASPDDLIEAVIYPLSKRFLSRRKIASDTTMRFWGRVMLCLKERQPFHKEFENSSEHYKRILARLVKVWNHSRGRTEYTEMLTELFSLIPETALKRYSLVDLIKKIAQARRYQLLRLFLKHAAGFQFDIGEPLSLEYSGLDKSSIQWHPELFSLLPADEAFTLWEKVQSAGNDVRSWESGWTSESIYFCQDQDDSNLADYLIIRAYLLRQSQGASSFTAAELDTMRSDLRQEVSRRIKKATQGRLPEIRSKWAVAALELCVAIGDLELYGETLCWARRFNKDPLTVQEIYGGYSLRTREVTDLVTVLPAKESPPVNVEELSKRIQSANDILHILFDTAMMGINEPSFRGWRDWGHAFELVNRVICKRIAHFNDFQDRTKMSDDVLYEALWKPTFALLEKMLPHKHILAPEGEVKFDHQAYSSLSSFQVREPETLREPTIRFLDQLAEYEDSIWKEFRLRQTPALVTADEIWPKGLTIQHLDYNFKSALPYLPYAQSRIEDIVFMNALTVLQPIQIDEETQLAIGPFIDSWAAALQLYIRMPGKLSKEEQRKERISRAWQHATVNLSKDRMSPEEAERFWWPVFEDVGVKNNEVGINEKADERREPSLPDADEDMQPIEWNPDPEYERISQAEKSKMLTPTCLDVLLNRPNDRYLHEFISPENSEFEFWSVKCVIPRKPRPLSFWDSFSTTYSKLTCKHVDAYVVAGILALNMKKGSDISLLKKPFPNSGAVRIPAVYLDQEFLEREVDTNVSGFTGIIDHFKYYVPPSLFAQLGASVLESVRRGPETEKPCGMLVWIINRLLEGASPSMAIPLIQQFVLENPDASSWHRPLLNPKALIHFRPADAKHFFETFTDAILDKLQEQVERRAKQKSDDESANKGPLVKVTTVKMLAQLLRESPVVDPGLAVELNIKILKRASHVDIRTAAVKGLTEAIANTTDTEVKKRIFDALLKYAAPIASSINESQPLTDWDALTSDEELPEIWKSTNGTLTTPTIMDLILNMGVRRDWQSEEGRAYKELTYTIMDASAENNQRWMRLFIKKHGFTMPDDAQLPAIPMFPTALGNLLRVMQTNISAKYVDMAKQYLLLRMNLPDWVSAITQAVRADQKLASSNSGQHWSNLWNHDYDMLTKSLLETIRLHLVILERKATDEKTQQEDSHHSHESFLFEIADIIIKQGNLNKFNEFVSDTLTATHDNAVWERFLERIDSLRTPAWQADQNRKPAVLPDTLSLKIKMLTLPLSASQPDKVQEVATRCAKRAVELLNDTVASGVPYQNSFNALQRELMNAKPKALMAITIGSTPALDDPNSVTLVGHLRVELAMALLDRSWIFRHGSGRGNEDDVLKQAEELVMKLSRSSVENFRNLAAPLKAIIENTDGWDLFS